VTPRTPQTGDKKLAFAYDYLGRRVHKRVHRYNGSSYDRVVDRWYVYDGWNLLLELDEGDEGVLLTQYTWGLDLSGSQHGAGGIGGLLATRDMLGTAANTKAIDLDGRDSHIAVPHDDAISFGDADFTIEAWVRLDALSGPTSDPQFIVMKKESPLSDDFADYAFAANAGNLGTTGRELALLWGHRHDDGRGQQPGDQRQRAYMALRRRLVRRGE